MYCNSLLCGISDTLLWRLQSVQNAAARVITRTPRRDHITPILHHLHWLPVRQQVAFKLAVLVYKALNNRAPEYLSQDCRLVGDIDRRSARAPVVTQLHLCKRYHKHTVWRSCVRCRRTTTLEQFASRCPSDQRHSRNFLPEVEDVFVWSRRQHLVTVVFRRCV